MKPRSSYRRIVGIILLVISITSVLSMDSCKLRRERKKMEARVDSAVAAQQVADEMSADADSMIAQMNRQAEIERMRADSLKKADSLLREDEILFAERFLDSMNSLDSTKKPK